MTLRFAQIGGARIGFINATWPFARLSADRNAIGLRCLFKFRFPRDRITRLSRYRGFFSTGLQIEHTVPLYPKFMLFWTFDFGLLTEGWKRSATRCAIDASWLRRRARLRHRIISLCEDGRCRAVLALRLGQMPPRQPMPEDIPLPSVQGARPTASYDLMTS
jgi:hypothetical protein